MDTPLDELVSANRTHRGRGRGGRGGGAPRGRGFGGKPARGFHRGGRGGRGGFGAKVRYDVVILSDPGHFHTTGGLILGIIFLDL